MVERLRQVVTQHETQQRALTRVQALAGFPRDKGAEAVTVSDIGTVFSRDNALYANWKTALSG